jgi:hypothetical protein
MLQSRISVPLEWTALVTAMSRIASVKWAVSAAVKAREFSTSYNMLIGSAVLA